MLAEDIRHPERQPIVFERRWDKIYKRKRETNEVGTEICPGTGVLKEEKFRNTGETLSLAGQWGGLESQRVT